MEEIQIPKKLRLPKSSEIIASIDDLLIQILLRLPVLSLLSFKLVSKHWLSLIANPTFRRRHTQNPNPAVGLFLPSTHFPTNPFVDFVPFFPKYSTIAPFRGPNFAKDHFGIKILQSCNGILLCCSFKTSPNEMMYNVYNHTTNQFSTLPKLEGDAKISGMSLAFDPVKSHHYIVVCVREGFPMEIYSSETRVWRTRGKPFTGVVDFENPVFWNNAVHWIGVPFEARDSLYFNVSHNVLEKMPNPPTPQTAFGKSCYYFGESCDHLHYIQLYLDQIQFNVYEMKRDYSEWFVKYRVDLSPVFAAYPELNRDNFGRRSWRFYVFSILSLVRVDEEDGPFLVLQIPGKVIRYNLIPKTFENLYKFKDAEFLRFPLTNGIQYIESICCV